MKLRHGILLISSIAVLTGLFLFVFVYHLYRSPLDIESEEYFELARHSSANDLVSRLARKNHIQYPRLIYYLLRINGSASELKAGVYTMYPGETLAALVHKITRGDVAKFNFTIIAGTSWDTVKANLKNAAWLAHEEPLAIKIYNPAAHPEGLLLAETYIYEGNTSALRLVQRANAALESELMQNWENRVPDLPYASPYEMLVAASIIEKETGNAQERPLISSVIVNRLRKNMRLQMDPTVIYAMGAKWSGTVSKKDLRIDSPYNTYRYRGLPPTPIAMVSRDAIAAAAHPKPSDYLYFVSRGDGTHQFSTNYQQQRSAVDKYIRGERNAE